MVYDERDTDESILLRNVEGAHQSQITVLAFDFHFSLIVTASIDGEIVLYDFETS